MTINEIKSVSICQWLKENGYGSGIRRGNNVLYCSPLRSENNPSFFVNTIKNLWHDFGIGIGGNLINLVERLHPTWSEHQVLSFIERQIKEKRLMYSEDYNARLNEEEKAGWIDNKKIAHWEQSEQKTIIEKVIPLSHPILRDYISQRRINYEVAQRYCKEVHYTLRGRRYFAIAFVNVANGMEVRNKLNKRCIGKKNISVIFPNGFSQQRCCVFEGFFDLLSYVTLQELMPDNGISISGVLDYFVLNGVSEVKLLLPHLREYKSIHCYLDNDDAGKTATSSIMNVYGGIVIDESYRYKGYNDLNDFLMGIRATDR